MSRIKDIIAKKESNKIKQMKYYEDKLVSIGTYNMSCPYCCGALSNSDAKKVQCIHCGYILKLNM